MFSYALYALALCVQADHQLALLQHGTRLYLVNMAAISRDMFYQLLLTRWEGAAAMQLGQPLHVGTLMELALRKEEAAGKWQVGGVDNCRCTITVTDSVNLLLHVLSLRD